MKTLKKVPIELVILKDYEFVPTVKEFGKLYYSEKYHGCSHLCLCGCGIECYLPIASTEWQLTINEGKPTITPSILQRFDCKSHYIITNGIANFV